MCFLEQRYKDEGTDGKKYFPTSHRLIYEHLFVHFFKSKDCVTKNSLEYGKRKKWYCNEDVKIRYTDNKNFKM